MAQDRSKRTKEPLLEWVAAGIGLVLTLGMMAVIGLEAVRGDASQLPAIEVRPVRVESTPSGFVVEIEVSNRTGATAAAVHIEGALMMDDAPVETSSLTLDYVPGYARRKGGLFFSRDPHRHDFEVRALGYQAP